MLHLAQSHRPKKAALCEISRDRSVAATASAGRCSYRDDPGTGTEFCAPTGYFGGGFARAMEMEAGVGHAQRLIGSMFRL
jgi:hypothetical protein